MVLKWQKGPETVFLELVPRSGLAAGWYVTVKPDVQEDDKETEAIKRNVVNYFQRLVPLVQNVPENVAAATLNMEERRQVVYVIATFVQMELQLRQKLLEFDSVRAKMEQLSS